MHLGSILKNTERYVEKGHARDAGAAPSGLQGLPGIHRQFRFETVLLVLFLVTLPFVNPWVRGDGVGYYAYARAPLISHNLDFTYDYQSANQNFRESRCDANGRPRDEFRTVTGHLENHFTVGPAMLWSPFLLLAHAGVLLARALGVHVAADGYSAPYRLAMALSTCLYGFLGVLISFRLARKYAGELWAFLATLAIWGGSSLAVYMYFNPSWSHAHSAFVCALFVWYWDATRVQRRTSQWVILGLIVGVMLDVYYANLMLVTILAIEAAGQYIHVLRSQRGSLQAVPQLLMRHLLFGAVVLAAMIPTFWSRWIVYGGPLRSGYVSIRDYLWDAPVFYSVLFSANHGLLAWTPLIAVAFLGLLLFALREPKVGGPLCAGVVAFYLFMSVYPDWAGISSFGNRFFISLTALFVLGLAFLLERAASRFRRPAIAAVTESAILGCFVLWNLGLMYQWGTHLIPARGPISFREAAANQFTVVPHRLISHLRSYIFRRSDLMRQIEERDKEQLKNYQGE